jgi:sugar/nucleoside kinase (ribokinase family)
LYDWKAIPQPELMTPGVMRLFGELCGVTLARAHARSGDRIAIAAYLGRSDPFDRAVARFAEAYADQNERDHRTLAEAVRTGRVAAKSE